VRSVMIHAASRVSYVCISVHSSAPQLLHEARGEQTEQKAAQPRKNAVAEGERLQMIGTVTQQLRSRLLMCAQCTSNSARRLEQARRFASEMAMALAVMVDEYECSILLCLTAAGAHREQFDVRVESRLRQLVGNRKNGRRHIVRNEQLRQRRQCLRSSTPRQVRSGYTWSGLHEMTSMTPPAGSAGSQFHRWSWLLGSLCRAMPAHHE